MKIENNGMQKPTVGEEHSKFAEFTDGVYCCLCVASSLENSTYTDGSGKSTVSQKIKLIFQGIDAEGRVGTLITRPMKYSFYTKSPWFKLMSKLFNETDPEKLSAKLDAIPTLNGHYFNVSVVTEISARNGHTYSNVASLSKAPKEHKVVPPVELPWFVKNENTVAFEALPGYTIAEKKVPVSNAGPAPTYQQAQGYAQSPANQGTATQQAPANQGTAAQQSPAGAAYMKPSAAPAPEKQTADADADLPF